MFRSRFLILSLFLFFPLSSYALEKICDASEINFDGTTLEDTCSWGTILDSYIWVDSFVWEYVSMPLWNWGNKYSLNHQELELWWASVGYLWTTRTNEYNDSTVPKFWQVPVGFLGSNRKNYIPYQPFYTEPVWFFGLYWGIDLNFPDAPTPPVDDTDYSMYPLIKPITEESSWWGWTSQSCDMPIRITDVSTTIKNDGFLDALTLSWQKKDNAKIKIIEISPESKTFYPQGNSYTEVGLKEGSYSYFVVSYNDCSPWIYSDIVRYDYKENKDTTIPYLTLSKSILSLTIPKTITPDSTSKFALICTSWGKEIVKDFLSNDKTFNLSTNLLKASFSCNVEFFDAKWILQTSETFLYTPLKKNLTNKEVLETIYGMSDSGASLDTLYQDIVTIEKDVSPENQATYWSVALILTNTILWVYAEDKDIINSVFKSLEIYPTSVKTEESIPYADFIKIYSFLQQNKKKYQQSVIQKMDDFFHPDENFVTKKLLETYFLTEDSDMLKSTDSAKYDILKKCFGFERCLDRTFYQTEKKSIDAKVEQTIALISWTQTEITYSTYIKILYKVLGSQEFIQAKYSSQEYDTFLSILTEAKTSGKDRYQEKVLYFDFYGIMLDLMEPLEIKSEIKLLTKKYLRGIIKVYDEGTKKDQLLDVLGNYLGGE